MNAVLIVLDTLRQDHVGCYGNDWIQTPNLDALAKESVLFTRMHPESLPTLPARRAIYTGNRVFPFKDHKVQKGDFVAMAPGWGPIEEEQNTLAEMLMVYKYRTCLISDVYHQFKPSKNFHRGMDQWTWIRGQETDAFHSGPRIPKEQLKKHIPENLEFSWRLDMVLEKYLINNRFRKSEADYCAPRVFQAAIDWLEENQDARQFFLTVESFDPHEPWNPPVEYRRLYDDEEVEDLREVIFSLYGPADQLTERELKRMRANYAGEVTMVDRWLGRFIDKLRESGKLDDTVLVIVSDHGHCIGEQGIISKQGYPMSREIADLVMLVRYPDGAGAGKVCDALCYHHDIPATILAALGQDLPKMDGRDLKPAAMYNQKLNDYTVTAWGPFVMVRDDDWWYNAYLWGDDPMLFKLAEDPGLQYNLADKHPDVVRQMAERAMQDAGRIIPDYLREVAESNVPGCTPLVPKLMK